jgi:glycosyltransferase involved in cell wall biosynthesis
MTCLHNLLCYHDRAVRILLDYRPALRARTGVGEYVHQIAAALAQGAGSEDVITLFSSSWKDRLPSDRLAGVRMVDARVPVRLLNFAWHRLGYPSVERFAGEQDIVHSFHPLLMPARRAAQVITIHDLDFLDYPERTNAEIRRDYAALAPKHAQRADAIVAVSHFTAAQVQQKLDVPPERLIVCRPGAPPWPARARPASGGPILFVGTLEPRKNVGVLLEAYTRLLKRVATAPRLVLAGRATREAAAWLSAIQAPPLVGHVDHLGYVDVDRRYDLYAAASMLVLPSHMEGFGLPVLEAMTVGVPVIVSGRGALPEVAGDAGTIVDAGDAEGLADAMARYLDDPQAAGDAAVRGVARSRLFSWTESARVLKVGYLAAIDRAARRR